MGQGYGRDGLPIAVWIDTVLVADSWDLRSQTLGLLNMVPQKMGGPVVPPHFFERNSCLCDISMHSSYFSVPPKTTLSTCDQDGDLQQPACTGLGTAGRVSRSIPDGFSLHIFLKCILMDRYELYHLVIDSLDLGPLKNEKDTEQMPQRTAKNFHHCLMLQRLFVEALRLWRMPALRQGGRAGWVSHGIG